MDTKLPSEDINYQVYPEGYYEKMREKYEVGKIIIDEKGTVREVQQRPYEEAPRITEENRTRFQKHLFIPDLHYPDYNKEAFESVLNFIQDYKPDVVHELGDWINATYLGKYEVIEDYGVTVGDEIRGGRDLFKLLVRTVRTANPNVEIHFYEGNHEQRMAKYLARNADALKDLTDEDGENVLSIPHLFHLKDLDVKWHEYMNTYKQDGVNIEHGNVVRQKAGYTANAMLDRRGRSGYSGHTHRLCIVTRSQGEDLKFWVECGSLCNLKPYPTYVTEPDWANGFAIGVYDKQENIMHPQPILIQNNHFFFNEKLY